MEKTLEQNTYVLQEDDDFGTVKIADDVVASIAGIAATEVEGVVSMAGNIGNELKSKMGVKNLAKGVKVEVRDDCAIVELAINMKYGYNIPETCKQVQEKVIQAINSMTGLTVKQVNVRIAGVSLEQD